MASAQADGGARRPNGIFVMLLLVVLGFGVGALYYSYKEPRVRAKLKKEFEAAPTTAEGRVQHWMEFFEPQAHHRLSVYARVSEEHPWIVTHAVRAPGELGAPLAFGLDVSGLRKEGLFEREGLVVVLRLDPPVQLGPLELGGDATSHVPVHPAEPSREEADARLLELARWFLKDLVTAIEADIPGARLEIRVGSA
jgi:hypothetical protein